MTETVRLEDATPYQLEIARNVRAQFRPAIVVMNGDRMGDKILVSSTNAVVGRAPHAEIRLLDVGISWEHARIEDQGGSWAVIDMGSTNGTLVNGERRERASLHDGDEIQIGRLHLLVRLPGFAGSDASLDAA